MKPYISRILKAWDLNANQISKPPDAKLSQVYLVENRYVLRSRPFESNTYIRFAAECDLTEFVAALTGYRFPQYQRAVSGTNYVIKADCFWTLHELIPGRSLGSWFELHRIDPSVHRQVLDTLRRLHTTSAGRFEESDIDRTRLLELVTPALAEAPDFLGVNELARLWTAFNNVAEFCGSYPSHEGCFVHGDFHHGNILVQGGQVTGFIDLDWCRVSSPYEDLAFTLMMLLRDYDNWVPKFRWTVYHEMLEYYGFNGDAVLLYDHLILFDLFDCAVFKSANFDKAAVFYDYQKRYLESVCQEIQTGER